MKIPPANVFLSATNLCKLTSSTKIYLEQESLGLGASLFGPVKLPFTLPAVTDTRFLAYREQSAESKGHISSS